MEHKQNDINMHHPGTDHYDGPRDIAIIEPNTLTALGLEDFLEEFMPDIVVRIFPSFEALIEDTPDMYAHYFVSAKIYFDHSNFFVKRSPKAIVLASGDADTFGVPYLNMNLPQDKLVQAFIRLRSTGHVQKKHPQSRFDMPDSDPTLTPREIDVLCLIAKGLTNKEIGAKLNIGLTTVISHRKNITDKLKIKSAPGLAIYAIMHGFIEVDSI